MPEGGGNPLEVWFSEIPPRARPWVMWIAIGTVVFGTVMSVLWYFRK